MGKTVIKVENLSKQYRLGTIGTGTLGDDLNRWWAKVRGKEDPSLIVGETNDRTTKGNSDYIWALKDINFEVKQGEILGIIGRNGAGKSTLLKILSRVTKPTTGNVKIKGRVASLLEVGTGFHPELTGRENVFLNGAIMGMRKNEIKSKFDSIVDFAGVERYIDTPVKRYSSGMYVRLAFAVSAFLEPEILIVDEVLAVGDAEFQKKCLGQMKDVSVNDGRTVLFVSHNINAVRNICTKGIYMRDGLMVMHTSVNMVLDSYLSSSTEKTLWEGIDGDDNLKILKTYIKKSSSPIKEGNEKFYTNEKLEVGVHIKILKDIKDLVVGFNILSNDSNPLLRTFYNDYNDLMGFSKGEYLIKFNIPPNLMASGYYNINFDVALPFVKKISSEKTNLEFELFAESVTGNRYFLENQPLFNSIVRPNLFDSVIKL